MLGVLSETNGQLFHAVQFRGKVDGSFFATLGCSKSSVGVHRTQRPPRRGFFPTARQKQ